MAKVRVIDLWTERVIRQVCSYLRSPFQFGNVDAGNYSEFGTDGRLSFHGVADLSFEIAPPAIPAWKEGLVFWDPIEKTLAVYGDVFDTKLNVGQETQLRVVNKTATNVALTNGQVVYLSGAQGQRPKVDLAIANDFQKSSRTIGMVTQASIANNLVGYTTTFGIVHDVDTKDFAAGDELWLSATVPGGVTTTRPGTGFDQVRVGLVLLSHPTAGEILFNPEVFPTKFGDVLNGNYSEFESDGTLKFNGDATVWDDVYPSSVTVGATGASIPAFTNYNGGLKAYEFIGTGVLSKEINFGFQIPHTYLVGSGIVPHLHLRVPNDATGGTIKFGCEYSWKAIGAAETATQTVYGTLAITANAGVQANKILSFGNIAASGQGISSIFMCRIFRDPGDVDDTFGASVWLKSADIHHLVDTAGSRAELVK